jgi:iron complex outermembrane receptor protein
MRVPLHIIAIPSVGTILATASLLALAAPAIAAETATPPQGEIGQDGRGDIVVTARKRSEALSQVPDTIAVFTEKRIEDARIRGIGDFIAQTPGFEIKQGQGNGFFQMSIRGITQTNGGEAPVTMVVDGVTLPFPMTFSSPLFDVAQIEVLKGPQGALYGQNAIGGAILMTTKPATNHFEARFTAGVTTHSGYDGIATLSGPIVADKVLFRVSGYVDHDGGEEHYLHIPDKRVARYSHLSGRGDLTFNLSDRLSIVLGADGGHSFDPGLALVPKTLSFGTGLPAALVNSFITPGQPSQDVEARSTLDYHDFTSKLTYRADFATVTWVNAYQSSTEDHVTDLDVSNLPFVYVSQHNAIRAYTQELRLASNASGPLRWVLGGYLARIRRDYNNDPVYVNANFPANLDPQQALYVPASRNLQRLHMNSNAIFGQADYDLTSKLQLTVGARYDIDPRRNRVDSLTGAGVATKPTVRQANTFKEFQPKASLRYSITPNANVYVTAAKGFRPGGFNDGSSANVSQAFPSETTETIEVGGKFALLDRRLFINLAGYTTNYKNQQVTLIQITSGGASQSTFNIDRTRIKGIEGDVRALPTRDLELTAGFSYIDGRIKKFGNSLTGVSFNPSAYVGNQIPLTTRLSLNGAAQLTEPLSDRLNLIVRGDVEHKGSMFWYADNNDKRAPYTLLNFNIGVRTDRWEIKAFGKNVTNKHYDVVFLGNTFTGAPGGFDFAFVSRGSRFGLEGTIRY